MTNEQRAMDEINLKSILGRDIAIGWSTDKLLYIDLGPGNCVAICGVELLKFMEWLRSAPPPSESEYSQTRDRMSTGCTHHGDEPIGQAGSTPAGRTESPPRDPAALGTPTDNKTPHSGPVLSDMEIAGRGRRDYYLSLLPKIREAARAAGYAIGVHGSLVRDFDLIAVPWVEDAVPGDILAHTIKKEVGGQILPAFSMVPGDTENKNPGKKPHGRMAWTILLTEGHNAKFIDLSVIDPRHKAVPDTEAAKLREDNTRLRAELSRADKDADDLDTALRKLCEPVLGYDGAWGNSGVNADPIPGIEGVVAATIAELEKESAEKSRLFQQVTDNVMRDVLVAIAGAVCTPEKGYAADGGFSQMIADVRLLRAQHDKLESQVKELTTQRSDV